MRVDGLPARGLWPPVGGGLCRRVVKGKVLRIDRPLAGGFLSLTAFQAEGCGIARRAMSMKSALRDWLSASYGMISILRIGSLRSPPLSGLRRTAPRESVSHDSQVVLLPYSTAITDSQYFARHCVPSKYVRWCDSCSLAPPMQGQNKTPRSLASSAQRIAKNKVPPPGGRWWRQPPKGVHVLARQGGCMVFPRAKPGCEGFIIRGRLL